jgi:hypothetical protein
VALARTASFAHGRHASFRNRATHDRSTPRPSIRKRRANDFETPVYYPDPDRLREELHRILGEARAAKTIPWDANRTGLYRTIFPQMTGCLPEDEGAQLRFDFETEMARLEAA